MGGGRWGVVLVVAGVEAVDLEICTGICVGRWCVGMYGCVSGVWVCIGV